MNFAESELKRTVREMTWSDRLLQNPPDLKIPNQPSVFSPFPYSPYMGSGYTKLMFLGMEKDLCLHNILTHAICDLWFGDTMTSILLVYLVELLLRHIRGYYGQANVSSKTLVDDRFLK